MSNQNGRSMIEMLGVLAIIGVLSVGGIAGYSKAMYRYKLNKEISLVTTIVANIQTLFINHSYGELQSLSQENLKALNLIPDEYWLDGGYFEDVYNGGTTLYINTPHGHNSAFVIGGICPPKEACVDFLSYDWKSVGVKMIEVDYDYWIGYPIEYNTLSNATKACGYSTSDGGMCGGIAFYFGDLDIDTYWGRDKDEIYSLMREVFSK